MLKAMPAVQNKNDHLFRELQELLGGENVVIK